MQTARSLDPSCIVAPDVTKVFLGLPIMAWTRREIQHEKAYSIAITGNFQATSEKIPQDFQKCLISHLGTIEGFKKKKQNREHVTQKIKAFPKECVWKLTQKID